MDTVEAAGFLTGIRCVTVPTVASTDAPTSPPLVYTEEGAFEEYQFFPRNQDLALVDSAIIAGAPASFMLSGLGFQSGGSGRSSRHALRYAGVAPGPGKRSPKCYPVS
ncbi:iron-containing alcohol dehydrogenase [Arthrobacter cheniae]|uniref:Iron-containing alcohol dehydrogenase n=1 Tax=Arthrobacter cheniae TaxID=1258888 RepID=A0A3A5M485_9MICC|nr:iron-containing alcohol dehydrogenase [Arthrobacter cheniae]RJT77725.1 iron-containing alcohol dehydrogenase [Arthrobacter cheniae]